MRKIIFLAIITMVGCLALPAQNNGFTVELSTVNSLKEREDYSEYHGLELNGGYQFNFLNRIYVEPQIGLTWLSHHRELLYGVYIDENGNMITPHFDESNKSTLGINLGAIGGVKICRAIGLFTGPDVNSMFILREMRIKSRRHGGALALMYLCGNCASVPL